MSTGFKYDIKDVIQFIDPKRMGMVHYGEIVEIRITKYGIDYVTQDHHIVSEKNIKGKFISYLTVEEAYLAGIGIDKEEIA